jgi:hypothetical protein
MITRLVVLAAVALCAIGIGVVPSASGVSLTGVELARAQVAPPADPEEAADAAEEAADAAEEAAEDAADTSEEDAPPAAAPIALPDDSTLDNTGLGALDQTDLGAPVDETNQPPVENPAPPAPPAAAPVAPAPSGATPVAPPAGSPPPVYFVINVPSAPSGTPGNAAPQRKSASKRKRASKKRKHAKKRKQQARKRKHAKKRKQQGRTRAGR